eukprot:COSAG06_NODE_956_length_11322_cov_30.048383_10_plen_65_part_00
MTQAVQLSEMPTVQGYHRRIIADWGEGPLYVLWDAIDAGAGNVFSSKSPSLENDQLTETGSGQA